MARVLLLHQYFPPDIAPSGRHGQKIASALAASGHDVSAIVAQPSYDEATGRAPVRERYEGIDVVRVPVGPFRGRRSRITRYGGYLAYLSGAAVVAARRSPEIVVTFHIPPFLPLLAVALARFRGAKVVYVAQDIHPDILIKAGWLRMGRPAIRAWNAFNRFVLSRSDRVVVLGEGMRRTLIGKGADPGRTAVIPLWADPAFPPLERGDSWRSDHGIGEDDLVALYAGNMGLMHPLDDVLDAAARVYGNGVRVVIAGDGVRREHWLREVERLGVKHVLMLPYQTDAHFRQLVAAADLALITLAPGMERLAVPSRPYAFLAAGRPVIAVSSPDADIARDVVAAGAGWQVDGADQLADLLLFLLQDREAVASGASAARRLYEERFTPEQAIARYLELVDDLAAA